MASLYGLFESGRRVMLGTLAQCEAEAMTYSAAVWDDLQCDILPIGHDGRPVQYGPDDLGASGRGYAFDSYRVALVARR